jgi:2-iminobutanoate/2-iminopropanoate deaminase
MRKRISTDKAPQAIGPYSQAIASGDLVFCSGQIALDPANGELVDGGIAEQTGRAFENLRGVLEAAGASLDDVVKTTVFLASMDDFPAMNDVYEKFFAADPPARSTVAVKTLPKNALFEIEAIARISQ